MPTETEKSLAIIWDALSCWAEDCAGDDSEAVAEVENAMKHIRQTLGSPTEEQQGD